MAFSANIPRAGWTRSLGAVLVLVVVNGPGALGQTPPSTNPVPAQAATSAAVNASTHHLSPLTDALVKMADAGVSAEVLQTYIQTTHPGAALSAQEIVVLKQHQVPDSIVNAAIQHAAKAGAALQQQKRQALLGALTERNRRYGGMDPESYDYFRYHYLHPRALAYANQRLFSYHGLRNTHDYSSYSGSWMYP